MLHNPLVSIGVKSVSLQGRSKINVGEVLGGLVGEAVGLWVGRREGEVVGPLVGDIVGFRVGDGVLQVGSHIAGHSAAFSPTRHWVDTSATGNFCIISHTGARG
jgi:hypothetical protein